MTKKTTRRNFMKAAALTGVGYWAMAGNASKARAQANDKIGLAGFGTGGKGDSDISSGARYCDVVVICDTDKGRLAQAQTKYPNAKAYTDYRKAFDEMEKSFDVVTVSTPDHTHTCIGARALRAKKHAYIQKPLTRTTYEARLLGQLAKEAGVCTQMGNQGSGSNRLRQGAAQIKAGVLGTVLAAHIWSNRPIWAQRPGRRETLETFSTKTRAEQPAEADRLIERRKAEIDRALANIDWENWLGPAPEREYWPGHYHAFEWRGWWDFGSGALGDMACHTFNQPYSGCDLKFPTSVVAKSSGHDYDSFPGRSEIKFEFPATEFRPAIECFWYDGGWRPPAELMAKYGLTLDDTNRSGALIVGEKGVMYDPGDNGGNWQLRAEGGERFEPLPDADLTYARNRDGHDGEFYRAIRENKPEECYSNFPEYAGPLTETILLGNLAVWTAAKEDEWGEKIEWDAKNLVVTNLASLKTPGVAELVKPKYRGEHRLD
ncbi:MAG: Gfo/Idh/MocA family oxidoreductase [Planctomycetaceae bacterium]|nr:Gfo/Idh/MocA family oxidoreductase [Planctomycetaceae bacterium]